MKSLFRIFEDITKETAIVPYEFAQGIDEALGAGVSIISVERQGDRTFVIKRIAGDEFFTKRKRE